MSILEQASLVVTPNAKKISKLYSVIPTNGTGDLDVVRATTATYVGSDGLIKTALANEPRFDYSNGSCPSILNQPQRTNLLLQSADFSQSIWLKTGISTTLSSLLSPNGVDFSYLLTKTTALNQSSNIRQVNPFPSIGTYTYSFFVKKNNESEISFRVSSNNNIISFNLDTKTFNYATVPQVISAKYVNYVNGWIRVIIVYDITSTSTSLEVLQLFSLNNNASYYIWGAQLEQGSNATSYIPTTTTSVTRNNDVVSKTGISSLIGQSEGTFYAEIQFFEGGVRFNGIELYADNNNRVYISQDTNDRVAFGFRASGTLINLGLFESSYNKFKVAIRYKNGDSVCYVNGVNISSSASSFSFTSSLNRFNFNLANIVTYNFHGNLFSCGIFPIGLTNTQLQELTTL